MLSYTKGKIDAIIQLFIIHNTISKAHDLKISCWSKVHRRNLLHQKPAELVIQIHNKTGCLFIIDKRIEGVIISVLTSISIVHGFKPQSGQTRDYVIGICWFSAEHAALSSKSKYWLAEKQNILSEGDDMFIRGLLCQWTGTINIQRSMLV